jgi:hypothetical protein
VSYEEIVFPEVVTPVLDVQLRLIIKTSTAIQPAHCRPPGFPKNLHTFLGLRPSLPKMDQ